MDCGPRARRRLRCARTRVRCCRAGYSDWAWARKRWCVACLGHSVRAQQRYHARGYHARGAGAHPAAIFPLGVCWGYTGANVATTPGRLIAIEGIDGSGKGTQLELLQKVLRARGVAVHATGFPHYQSWFGTMVGQFLNGKFGALESVDPHFAALLYAGDRFEAKHELTDALAEGKLVLADRYIASNLAHQTGRVHAPQREEFIAWLEHLEYSIYGLPREDRVIYLRVP